MTQSGHYLVVLICKSNCRVPMGAEMGGREFIKVIAGSAAWPATASAQQPVPIVGFLHSPSRAPYENLVAAFRQRVGGLDFIEGKNVIIDFRWAEGHPDRLAPLASDLVRIPVAVLVAGGGNLGALPAREGKRASRVCFQG